MLLTIYSFLNKRRFNRTPNVVLRILLLGGILWEIAIFSRFPQQGWVHGLTEAWFASNGLVFYKDFVANYTPLLRILMVPLHQTFGFTQSTTISLSPIISLSTLLVLFLVSIKFLQTWYRTVPIAIFLLWEPFLGENHFTTNGFVAFLVLVIFALWLLWDQKPLQSNAFFLGLVAAVGIMSLQLIVPFVGVLFLTMLFKSLKEKKYQQTLFFALLGFSVPIGLILAWFLLKSALTDFFYWTVLHYFTSYPYTEWGKSSESIIIFSVLHVPIVLLLFTYYLQTRRREGENFPSFSAFLILLSLPLTFWFAVFHPLRFQISLPVFALAFGLGIQLSYQQLQKLRSNTDFLRLSLLRLSLLISLILLLVFVEVRYIVPKLQKNFYYPPERRVLTYLYEDDPMFDAVQWVKSNTPQQATLFVIGDPLFYLESGRLLGNRRGSSNLPITYEPLDHFRVDLLQKPPDYWVVDERIWVRYHDMGRDHVIVFLKKLLDCEPVVRRIEYFTIRKNVSEDGICI